MQAHGPLSPGCTAGSAQRFAAQERAWAAGERDKVMKQVSAWQEQARISFNLGDLSARNHALAEAAKLLKTLES